MSDRFFAHFANQRIGAALVLSLIVGANVFMAAVNWVLP